MSYLLDRDLSSRKPYPSFEQLGTDVTAQNNNLMDKTAMNPPISMLLYRTVNNK